MQITCNNPIEKGITSDKIKETIELRWKTEYYCFCYETGEQGTYHVHIYIKFKINFGKHYLQEEKHGRLYHGTGCGDYQQPLYPV